LKIKILISTLGTLGTLGTLHLTIEISPYL
jgi:hypothetical protein